VVACERRAPVLQNAYKRSRSDMFGDMVLHHEPQAEPVKRRPHDHIGVVDGELALDADTQLRSSFSSSQAYRPPPLIIRRLMHR
jgi:hypothetical protein